MIGGYAKIPPGVQPERCHVALKDGDDRVTRWFGEPGATKIRFEFTVPADRLPGTVLELTDAPLAGGSVEEARNLPKPLLIRMTIVDMPAGHTSSER